MRLAPTPPCGRKGVAAVEAAVVLLPLFIIVVCVWEVGRLIEAQQVLVNAAREGARVAASGRSRDADGSLVNEANTVSTSGSTSYITPTNTGYVTATVIGYIQNTGFSVSYMKSTGAFAGDWDPAKVPTFLNVTQNNTVWQTAAQGDRLRVTATMPTSNVRWVFLGNIINLGSTLTATVEWTSMKDIPLSVSPDSMKN